MNIALIYAIESSIAPSSGGGGVGVGGQVFPTSQYAIPIFLAMIFAAAVISSRSKIPHTMILVGFGIAISFFDFAGLTIIDIKQFRIDPKLIINFIIPPLIFEAMMKVNYKEFKAIRISALLLATIGVVVATLVAGLLLTYIAGLAFSVAFTFAALIAPTDPAIVIEIFKRVKVPKQLSTLMEFEASFNDATGLIVFSSITALTFAAAAVSTTISSNNSNVLSPPQASSPITTTPTIANFISDNFSLNNLYFINSVALLVHLSEPKAVLTL
ncbi:MAG: cation:proton antiporter [Nitrososphaeraceae archaeon]|nr:cation:proton antiporter [Nitrososphaeraceae archaeon]